MKELIANPQKVTSALLLITGLAAAAPQPAIASTANESAPVENAQTKQKITGVVKDAFGEPITGASVVEKGTQNGITTDLDGKFTLSVTSGATLTISFIGYQPQQVKASQDMSVVLQEDQQLLEETVVVGYGTQKKKDLTGAVASVSSQTFADLAVNDISQALAGRVAGLDIKAGDANPGSTGTMTLRGHRSFIASNDPLIILDGVTFYGSLNDINPNDIKSIDVLKDASSTAIYGSKGANGVIIITSKRGDAGQKPTVQFESQFNLQVPGKQPWMNAEQWVARLTEGVRATGKTGDEPTNYVARRMGDSEYNYYSNGGSTDWQDLLLQNGFGQKYQLSVMGGNERVSYNIAANVLSKEGIVPSRRFERYTVRPNIDINITKNFKVGMSTLLSYNNRHSHVSAEAYTDARALPPTAFPYDEEGNIIVKASNTASWYKNPLTEVETDAYRWEKKSYAAYVNLFADWQILPSLNWRLTLAEDLEKNTEKKAAVSESSNRHGDGDIASIYNKHNNRESIENVFTFDKSWDKEHHLTLTAIQSWQQSHMDNNYIAVQDVPYFDALWNNIAAAASVNSYTSGMEDWQLASFAGRLFYSLKDRYLLNASFRADGASQFSDDHKWGFFPSVALGWRISDEAWMKSAESWLSNLKLRLSYGVSGNQGISPYQTQGTLTDTKYSFDDAEGLGMRPGELANKDLKWEKTAVTNIGLDFGFFGGRLGGSMEYYYSKTTDLLLYRQLPVTTGFTSTLQNVGSTQNKGFELSLNSLNIQSRNFQWTTALTFYLNREEIVELYNGKVDDVGNKWFIGNPISVYYDYEKTGIWQTDEADVAAGYSRKPGQIKVADFDESGTVNDADRKIIGSAQPDFVANMVNNFKYRNFDLAFELYMRWGHTIYVNQFVQESCTNLNGLKMNYWTPENATNDYPRPDESSTSFYQASTLAYKDGSFLRLKNLSLGYTLPKNAAKALHLQNLRAYLTGENLLTWSKAGLEDYKIDPESGSSYPTITTWTLGLNVTF